MFTWYFTLTILLICENVLNSEFVLSSLMREKNTFFKILTREFTLRKREEGVNALCAPIIWNRMKKLEEVPAKSLFWPSPLKSMSLWPGPENLKGTDATSQYYCEIEGRINYSHVCLLFCWGELLNKCCCFDFCLCSAVGKQLSPESGSNWLIRRSSTVQPRFVLVWSAWCNTKT